MCALLAPIDPGLHRLADEQIVLYAKEGSKVAVEHLLGKYKGLVEGKARMYFLAGADHDDVIQEGMIGLYKAIRDFRTDKATAFRAFAEVCVTRQILTAVKTATRQKHLPLNRYISLHRSSVDPDVNDVLLDILPDTCVVDPEKRVLDDDMRDYFNSRIYTELSGLETQVLRCYLKGLSYREMAVKLSCRTKVVDNALQRIKRKISERIAQY